MVEDTVVGVFEADEGREVFIFSVVSSVVLSFVVVLSNGCVVLVLLIIVCVYDGFGVLWLVWRSVVTFDVDSSLVEDATTGVLADDVDTFTTVVVSAVVLTG